MIITSGTHVKTLWPVVYDNSLNFESSFQWDITNIVNTFMESFPVYLRSRYITGNKYNPNKYLAREQILACSTEKVIQDLKHSERYSKCSLP